MDIIFTDLAAQKVKEIRAAEKIADDTSLRVKVAGGGCNGFQFELYFDKPQDGDVKLNVSDISVIVDNMSIQYLDGTTIDYVDGLQGAGFKFSSTAITSSCGCGKSVSF